MTVYEGKHTLNYFVRRDDTFMYSQQEKRKIRLSTQCKARSQLRYLWTRTNKTHFLLRQERPVATLKLELINSLPFLFIFSRDKAFVTFYLITGIWASIGGITWFVKYTRSLCILYNVMFSASSFCLFINSKNVLMCGIETVLYPFIAH